MGTQTPIRIIIVDDHAMLRRGLAVFLMSYEDLKLVGEASNGKEALALCADQEPDIVLMDLMMPIMDGIAATRHICHNFPDIQVIALTSFGEERLIKDVLEAGAISYLFKKTSADDLAKAIRAAQDGNSTYAPEVTDILVQSVRQPHSIFDNLTPREREVLALMVKGMGNTEIAEVLVIGLSTTKSHVSSILAKLGVTSRTEVIAMVMEDSFRLRDFYIP
jgi:NarL family two-component system response regulator LiaR